MTTKRIDTKAKQTAEPRMQRLQIVFVLMVDGKPAIRIPYAQEIPVIPEGQTGALAITIDGREVARQLEPFIGPSNVSKLWTPRGNQD